MAIEAGQLETMYREHAAAVLAYLRRTVAPPDQAEDLLQETFLQALRREDRLAEVSSPRAWLLGIARFLSIRAIRSRRQVLPLQDEHLAAPAAAVAPDTEALHRAIARLPEGQREALELRLVENLTYEEIADVLEIPAGTVRSRLHNAVASLRRTMTGEP